MLTKAQEIAALREFAARRDHNSYLAPLFSEKLIGWVENQIRVDAPPDLYGTLAGERNLYKQTMGEKQDQVHTLKSEIRLAVGVAQDNARVQDLEISSLKVVADFAKAFLGEAEQEIVKLKARLYDMGLAAENGAAVIQALEDRVRKLTAS